MKLRMQQQVEAQPNMSSMTDIVFLLLIFFLLTFSLSESSGLVVDLPKSKAAPALSPQVNVTITADLSYYVDDQKATLETLRPALQSALQKKGNQVLLNVDQAVSVAQMIQVADIAAALNAQVAIATQPQKHEPGTTK